MKDSALLESCQQQDALPSSGTEKCREKEGPAEPGEKSPVERTTDRSPGLHRGTQSVYQEKEIP